MKDKVLTVTYQTLHYLPFLPTPLTSRTSFPTPFPASLSLNAAPLTYLLLLEYNRYAHTPVLLQWSSIWNTLILDIRMLRAIPNKAVEHCIPFPFPDLLLSIAFSTF